MSEMNLTLRIKMDADGTIRAVGQVSQAVGKIGPEAQKSGREAEQGFGRARRGVESISRSLDRMQRIAASAFAGLVSFRAVNRVLESITSNAIQQEQTLAQLETRIRSTGGAAGRSLQQLTALSSQLQDTTTFANEDIERMMATLMTFTSVSGDVFDGATMSILNMSAALGTDLQSAALQVGKALNDPIQGVTALQRAGIQLNDTQREQIRLMVESGNVAGAQRIILAELETQFGGTAEAMRGTFGGALVGLRNAFQDLLKFEGEMGGLAAAIEGITRRLQDPELKASVESALVLVLEAIPPVLSTVIAGLEGFVTVVTVVTGKLDLLLDGLIVLVTFITTRLVAALALKSAALLATAGSISVLNIALLAATIQTQALAVSVRAGTAAWALMGGPIGIVALALGGAIVAIRRWREQVAEVASLAGPTGDALARLRSAATGEWNADSVRQYRDALADLNTTIQQQQEELDKLARRRELFAAALFSPALFSETVRGWMGLDDSEAEAAARRRIEQAQQEKQALEEVQQARAWVAEQFGSQAERYALGAQKIAEWSETAVDWLERFGLVTRNAAGGVGEMAAASAEIVDPLQRMLQQLEQQWFVLEAISDGHTSAAMALLSYQEQQALAAAAEEDAANRTTRNTEAVRAYFAQLRQLTGQIEARTAAEQAARAAQQALQQQASGLASSYQQLLRQADPLRAETERLTKLLGDARGMAALTDEQLAELGLTAEILAELIALANAELEDLGTERLSAELESLVRWVEQMDMDPLVRDIETLERALAAATDPEIVARLEAAIARLRKELAGAGLDVGAMMMAYADASQTALRSIQQLTQTGSREYRAIAVAIEAANVAAAVGAILNQGMGDPYTAPARMAAMAAAVASLVGSISANFGGRWSDTAGQRQAAQGTGSVLGAADIQSESILRATETTADAVRELVGINRGMLRALINLNNALASAGNLLARGAGGAEFDIDPGFVFKNVQDAVGGLLGKLLDPLGLAGSLLGGKSKITDEGILIVGGTISEMIDEVMVGAYQEVQSRSWKYGRKRTRVGIGDLDDQVVSQFQLVFDALADTVFEGAAALGLSADAVEEAINNFIVPETFISLKDLTGEEQQKALEAVFGRIFDNLAGSVVPWIAQFQQVGEGLGETLVRVATGVQVMQEAVSRLGFALDETDPERFAQASEGLIELAGGLDQFISRMLIFFDKFADDATRFATAEDDLTRAFEQAGLVLPETREAMWALMQTLDATSEAGREQIATLLELAEVADAYYKVLERIEAERAGLERQLLVLQGDTVALRALELEKLDESNRALQARIWAIEDERAATELANRQAEELAQILRGAGEEIARLTLSPLRNEFRQLEIRHRELTARARELGAGMAELELLERSREAAVQALIGQITASIQSITERLFGQSATGADSLIAAVDDGAQRMRDAIVRALEGVAEWLRRSSFTDPSLTPVQQMAAMQAEFDRLMNIALTGSGQEQADAIAALPQLASQLEALGVQLWGSATAEFQDFRAGLVAAMQQVLDSVVPPPAPDPVTGSQIGAIGTAIDQAVMTLGEQRGLVAQLLEEIGLLAQLTSQSPLEIAREFGVPLRDAIELLIGELQEGTTDTIHQLAHIANTLGVTLMALADDIGFNIGELIDHESLLSQALQEVISTLPQGIQDELWDPLRAIWEATTEADANAALADLLAITDELPAWIRNLLAPYFEEIDPVDYLLEQVGLLESIRQLDIRQAEAAEATADLLARVVANLAAANEAADIPAFARGGWVNGSQIIRAGEAGRELILPNAVSEFFAREGIPIRAGGGDDRRIVEHLRELIEVERGASQRLDRIADAQQAAGIQIATGLQDVRAAVKERDLAWR